MFSGIDLNGSDTFDKWVLIELNVKCHFKISNTMFQ